MKAGFADMRYNVGVEGNKVSLFVGSGPLSTVTPDSLDKNRQNVDSGPLHWGHPMSSGVYEIVNTVNGHRYIGSSVNMPKRFLEHKSHLRKGVHHSVYLQRAWNSYGEDAFIFRPLLICDPEAILLYEQRCLDGMEPEYNLSPTAGNNQGITFSDEARANMSAAHVGIIPWNKGKKGAQVAWNKGVKSPYALSEETRKKMSQSRQGKCFTPMTDEIKEKIGKANAGKPKPPRTDEHRRKLSEAAKRQWAKARGES